MSQDVSHVLNGWDFDPHELNVRVIVGDDGNEKIQMRTDLGLLQMEMNGRPDGQRPHGFESLLEYYEQQAKEYGTGYHLSSEATDELFREGNQFYHRYLSLFHLGRYEPVVRDTERNVRLFAFVRKHAKKKRDQWRFDQYRPFVLMMNARARAMLAMESGDRAAGLAEVERGKQNIEAFLVEYNRPVGESECFELEFLKRWQEELSSSAPPSVEACESTEIAKLKVHLQKAIEREDYECAAMVRDQIKRLGQTEMKTQD